MKKLIENFTAQLKEAIEIGKKTNIKLPAKSYNQIVVSGLGGSGIGASIVQEYVFDKLKIPFNVNKNYFIPSSVNKDTLFIACSYSGNTEETLQAVEAAKKQKATIICITSGGKLATWATKNNYDLFIIPAGMPPRSCIGYSLIQILFILNKSKLISNSFIKEIENSIQEINAKTKKTQQEAKKIASKLKDKYIAIYTNAGHEGLAIRFKQQLFENSKVLAWNNTIPEMTHNEIVGWKKSHEKVAVVYCFSNEDYKRNLKRMDIMKSVTKKYKATNLDVEIIGSSYFEKVFYFIHFTDWISIFLSEINNFDAMEINVIDSLKAAMAKK